jgi:chromosome partitioning protein
VLANLKGGVGKTTVAISLASSLGRGIPDPETAKPRIEPQHVLLIDLEPACTASTALGIAAGGPHDSCAVLFQKPGSGVKPEEVSERLRHLTRRPENEPIDLIPADRAGVEAANGSRDSEYTFADNLRRLTSDYDHIIIDLPATTRERVMRSALNAAHGVIIPVLPDTLVIRSMESTLDTIEDIRRGGNPGLRVDGWLLSRAGFRNDADADLTHTLLQEESPYPTFKARIRTLKPIQRAAAFRCSVYALGGAQEAQRDFSDFVTEWYQGVKGTV